MSITPTYAHVELSDGTQHVTRILLADRLKLEKTAKVRQWDMEADGITVNAFTTWAALVRAGLYKNSYETFVAGDCVDLFVTNEKPADELAEDDPLNPTGPATQSS